MRLLSQKKLKVMLFKNENNDIYYRYSEYLIQQYGERVYKLPVNLPVSCPNRTDGRAGCSFCGGAGAGFENLPSAFSVSEQLEKNKAYIGKRYKAKKFIAYFQNFTNTFLPVEEFERCMKAAVIEDVVEIAVSTRPDCIRMEYLEILKEIKQKHKIQITIELGLQTANYHSLVKVDRGHTLAEYIEAAIEIKQYGFEICTHLILNLPWDDRLDVIESAKIVSALKSDFIKLHALYIEKDTKLSEQYLNHEISICTVEEYKKRVILFLEHISPYIVVERLIGRVPEQNTVFSNWGMSWWKIRDEIEQEMKLVDSFQGKEFHYLGGSGVKCFFR